MASFPRIRELVPEELDLAAPEPSGRFDFVGADRRGYRRAPLDAPVLIRLFDGRNRELCRGRALLHDLSLDGAFLTGIRIEQTTDNIPPNQLGEFERVGFTITEGPFQGAEAEAVPVRLGETISGVGLRLSQGFRFNA